MKTKKIQKILATTMVISTSTTFLPTSIAVMAETGTGNVAVSNSIQAASGNGTTLPNASTEELGSNNTTNGSAVSLEEKFLKSNSNDSATPAAVYYNNFEDGKKPDAVSGQITSSDVSIDTIGDNHVMKFASKFDGTDSWSNNMHGFGFYHESSETIPKESVIQFDLLIPTSQKSFSGTIKCTGALKDSSWAWQGGAFQDVTTESFTDLGNGYSSTKVSITLNSDVSGLKAVVAQISAYQCNYQGNLYMDNLKVVAAEAPKISDLEWNFDKDNNGWSYGGEWSYNGPIDNVVNYDDSTIGSGALKLSLDYSKDSSTAWSEFKISKDLGTATSFNGYNVLTYDFIYDPSKMTTGKFQTKLSAGDSLGATGEIDLNNSEDIGSGLKKAKVKLKFTSQNIEANSITLGIVGSSIDYKGDVYIDNIKFDKEEELDGYVEKTATTVAQVKVEPGDLEGRPSSVKLVDSQATSKTADLYSYLMGVGKSKYVLYGHQNDTHNKAFLKDSQSNSDTKDVTGSIAAVCGIDASFTADEVHYTDQDKQKGIDVITKGANLAIDTAKQGGTITVSAHMPNFELVKEKGKDADGKYDYSEYSSNVTTGNIVPRIMPGGDLNEVYTGYLDRVSEFAHKLDAAGVPVLFRPFHENNGSWFWWGKAFCDEEGYKNLYRYTVQYLRDAKNVHNFLYVYSPGATFTDDNDYLSRYPGDEFVDVLGFDMYDTSPTADYKTDPWMNSFKGTVDLVSKLATTRGKLSAVSEVGISSMPISGNADKDWFSHVANIISDSDMAYYMTWSNYDTKNFFAPYMVSDTKGHEMINNFINYYNEDESVFADGVGNYSSASTSVDSAYSYGFITGPTSSSRILEPTKITASVKGYNGQIKFVLKNKAGNAVETLNAMKGEDGAYSADITQVVLDKIGQTIGSIELYSDNTKLDTLKAIFNIKEAEKDPKVVDDFESYSGDNALLQQAWATCYGTDCNVKPTLDVNNKYEGEDGLAFNYKITAGQYAGITKSLDVDWSGCDALQIWVKPDGKGQKLVVQLTSNGEDFEVWMPEFAATTEAKLLTIPFSDFKGKNNGTFDPAHISKMGLWCNTIGTDTVDSVMYFDNIKAINTKASENPNDGVNTGEDANTGGGQTAGNANTGGLGEAAMPSTVVIRGTGRVGGTLTAKLLKEGSVEFTPSKGVTYAWYRLPNKGDDIANGILVGNGKSYELTDSDKNYYIKVVVTYNSKTFENITSLIAERTSSNSSSSSSSSSSNSGASSNTVSTITGTTTENSVTTGVTTAILNTSADGTVKLVDSNGQPKTGWQQINGTWYLANETGTAQTGWQQVKGNWYLLAKTGAMQTGWQLVNGKWYLLASSGQMQTGWQKVDDKWYYLYSDGSMAIDTVIDGYTVDASGAWV